MLAVFLIGVLAPRVSGRGAVAGLLAGVGGNVLLWRLAPSVSWLWWNPAGLLVAAATALALDGALLRRPPWPWPRQPTWVLAGAFVLMLVLLAALPRA